MASAQVSEVARILGLSSDAPPKLLSVDQAQTLKAILVGRSEKIIFAFWSEFGVRYLPEIINMAMEVDVDYRLLSDIDRLGLILQWIPLDSPSGSRFARDRPSDLVKFYVFLLDAVTKFPESMFRLTFFSLSLSLSRSRSPQDGEWVSALRLYVDCFDEISESVSDGSDTRLSPFPKPSSSQKAAVKKLVKAVATSSASPPAPDVLLACKVLEHETLNLWSIDMVQKRAESLRVKPLRWWSCEWAWAEVKEGRKPASGACVAFTVGEDMMRCGGCLNVRYCSQGHQRLHWKRHKPTCFKPSW